jgi:hypothetical protein
MEQPEQNVAARTETKLPKPAALQDTRPSDAAVSSPTGAAVFETEKVSIYYGSFGPYGCVADHPRERDHGVHRPVRLRQDPVLRTLNRLNDLIRGSRRR